MTTAILDAQGRSRMSISRAPHRMLKRKEKTTTSIVAQHESHYLEPDFSDWSISRAPHSMRKGKEEAYVPQIVSIGPLHFGKQELGDMDKRKKIYLDKFFERTGKKPEDVSAIIEGQEKQIRSFYSETSELGSKEYVQMILQDATFILELLLRNFYEDDKDKLLRIPADKLALKLDLLLLENQLPYFLLEKIYNSNEGLPSLKEICLKFFRSLFFDSEVSDRQDFKHFTDLLRHTLVQHFSLKKKEADEDLTPLPCATKLRESGVKFTGADSRCLLDVSFKRGELRMPQFLVHHQTETILRNIMALEQCVYPRKTVVCDYVKLLDSLIEDKQDAQLLVKTGIISNSMGDSQALASLFNELGAEIPISGSHFDKIHEDMKNFHKNKFNRSMAKLRRVYFGDIWKATATIAASVLLILTFIQTINSFK